MSEPADQVGDVRSEEILGRVRGVFARKGFDGASMQDLGRAAEMSVGNFYRYFPSKNAIIEALIERDIAEIERVFATVMESPDPRAELMRTIASRIELARCADDGTLWAEIEAIATRRPEIAGMVSRMEVAVTRYLRQVFARISGMSQEEIDRRFSAHAATIVLLVRGSAIGACGARPVVGSVRKADLDALVIRLVEKIVDEVCAASAAAGTQGEGA